MPTERFFTLNETKRKRICDAIICEYHRTSYGEMQISKIARNADVSRASLYTYFRNKEDLFRFALEQIREQKEETEKLDLTKASEIILQRSEGRQHE